MTARRPEGGDATAGLQWTEAQRSRVRQSLNVEEREDGSDYRGYIDDGLVEGALDLVVRSGVLKELGRWHAEERRGPGGRPAAYRSATDTDNGHRSPQTGALDLSGHDNRDQLILTLMIVLQRLGEAPQLKTLTDLVTTRLSHASKQRLGIVEKGQKPSAAAVNGRIKRAWKRFTSVCDPSPAAPGGRRLPRAEVEKIQATRDPESAAVKAERLRWLMNALLDSTLHILDEPERKEWNGNIAIDATPIATWGKRGNPSDRRKRKPTDSMSPEWSAGWYHRHDEALLWAHALHIAVSIPDPYTPGRFPVLAVGVSLDTPNQRNGENAAAICKSIVSRGHPVGDLVTDRGYFGQSLAEDFNWPVEALGYRLIGDYKQDQRGLQGRVRGAIVVDGNLYSPGMPEHLIEASRTYDSDHDWKAAQDRIRQRAFYLLKRHDGNRLSCPALAARGTVSCVVRPDQPRRQGTSRKEHAVVDRAPQHMGDVCQQRSVTIDVADLGKVAKLVQPLQYRSQEWIDRYEPARSMNEGYNGYIKDAKHENVEAKANRRVRGFAANAIVAVVGLVAANIRKVRSFLADGRPAPTQPKLRPRPNEFTGPPTWVQRGKTGPGWGYADLSPPVAA